MTPAQAFANRLQEESDRVLDRAERLLAQRGKTGRSDFVDLYRRFWRWEEARLRRLLLPERRGVEIARRRADLMDLLVRHVAGFAAQDRGEGDEPAVIAMGGYGRGELSPSSDIDLLFLHAGEEDRVGAEEFTSRTLYLLWDIGLTIGHACRSLDECLEVARRDHRTATAMIESRFVWGDRRLFDRLRRRFEEAMFSEMTDSFVAARLQEERERRRRHGTTVFLQEPNLKSGPGGLRDAHAIWWLTYPTHRVRRPSDLVPLGLLSPASFSRLQRAYDFLLWVRDELHSASGRGNDVFSLRLQPRVAEGLGYPGTTPVERTENLMRDVYLAMRALNLIYRNVLGRMGLLDRIDPERSPKGFVPHPAAEERADGFVIRSDGTVEAESPRIFREDPLRLIRVFRNIRERNLEPGPRLRTLIRDNLAMIDDGFRRSREVTEAFVSIVDHRSGTGRVLRRMHEVGLLGALIPEFGRLTCLVQHEYYHRYTADEHTLVALEKLDDVFHADRFPEIRYRPLLRGLENPGRLVLGILLHDVGRGVGKTDHCREGARLAADVVARMGMEAGWADDVRFLVANHLLMSRVSQRRDLDDRATIRSFAAQVGEIERLEMLTLLTLVDAQATGQVWSEWKDALLWELYERTREWLTVGEPARVAVERLREERLTEAVLAGSGRFPAETIRRHLEAMPVRYLHASGGERIVEDLETIRTFLEGERKGRAACFTWSDRPQAGHSRATICTRDRPGLFSLISGALSLGGLNILDANVFTRADGLVVDAFRLCDARGGPVSDPGIRREVEELLEKSLRGEIDLARRFLDRKESRPAGLAVIAPPANVTLDLDSSETSAILEIDAPDRWGLLHDLSRTLAEAGMSILLAKVNTEQGVASDVFYVVDQATGGKPSPPERLHALVGRLREVIR